MKRRDLLKGALSAALTVPVMPSIIRSAQAADAVTLFGVKDLSGGSASYGKFAEMGSQLAVRAVGTLFGQKVGYNTIDLETNPAKSVRKVQDAIEQNGARFFNGCTLSSAALAVGKEVDKVGGIFTTPAGADEITGAECNRGTFRWSVSTFGAIEQTVRPLVDLMPKAKRWYTITPQYVFGEALLANAKTVFEEKGIEHVGNSYHSMQEKEFSGYLTNALAQKPDVLLLLNFGAQCSAALRQAVDFGFKQNCTILVAWSQGLDQFQSLGTDIIDGVYFGAQYWHEVDTPGNKEMVGLCRKEYGINPNYPMAADYIGTRIILEAIKAANSVEPAKVRAKLEGLSYQGPTGEETVRPFDHQVIKDYYLLRGNARASVKDPDQLASVVSAGKSFVTQAKSLCKMG